MEPKYFVEDCCICRSGKEGVDQLTNFTAKINKELVYHDGAKTTTHLKIGGAIRDESKNEKEERIYPEGRELPEVTIPASEFAGLGWVADKWGMAPIIYPAAGGERDLRTAIQIASTPTREHIFTHTGWVQVGKEQKFISMSGGIGRGGLDSSLRVELPHELSRYELPAPAESREAFLNSLRLINIGPPETLWPLLLAAYRAAVGPVDFAVHLAGRTGTFKSEVCSLIQSHFGATMDARHLPASWSSTGNAIEHLAYAAKNVVMVLDDFVPVGTAYHVRSLQKTADQIFRGQGNQAGRARLTDVSNMQTTYYPRGLIVSTGEDIPEGHSMRSRILILELSPDAIDKRKLTVAQSHRADYAQAVSDWVQWLAKTNASETLQNWAVEIRDQNLQLGHSRTPAIVGQLIGTVRLLGKYAVEEMQWLSAEDWKPVAASAVKAVTLAAESQTTYLESADPVQAALDTIRLLLGAGMAHVKSRSGGIPEDAEKFGWKVEQSPGELPNYRTQGPRIGWVDTEAGEFYLDANAVTLLKKHSGGRIAVTPQTLQKRMKESGVLARCDDSRQRNTVRQTLERHQRQVLCMSLADVFDDAADDE
jgi:hypothetical protein